MDTYDEARNKQSAEGTDRGLIQGQAVVRRWLLQAGIGDVPIQPLKRRYWGGVFRVRPGDGKGLIFKTGDVEYDAQSEAEMLRRLADGGLRMPSVVDVEDGLLVLCALPMKPFTPDVAFLAGAALARMHRTAVGRAYGYERDTWFGALALSNDWHDDWRAFFAEQRLEAFAVAARDRHRLSDDLFEQVEEIAERCRHRLPVPEAPALLHGDVWTNNVMATDDGAAFLDPASFYGDPGYEVAFMLCYLDCRSDALAGYTSIITPSPAFWSVSLPVYRLCFDLAHLALFGRELYTQRVKRSVQKARIALL
ncbi:MAG: fructosamine kinase family protein [Alphaproteobacteria bacterium]